MQAQIYLFIVPETVLQYYPEGTNLSIQKSIFYGILLEAGLGLAITNIYLFRML